MFSFFGGSGSNKNSNELKNDNSSGKEVEKNSNNQNSAKEHSNENSSKKEDSNNQIISLHKEELDINKNKIQSGEVIITKEVVEEKKTIEIPVTHEEVIIERKILNNEVTDTPIGPSETIRIPIREEQVEVNKYTVLTEEISAKKREVQENKTIEANLKKEEAKISTTDNEEVTSKSSNLSMN